MKSFCLKTEPLTHGDQDFRAPVSKSGTLPDIVDDAGNPIPWETKAEGS